MVPADDLAAGLSAAVYEKIRSDVVWAGQAVDVITRIIGAHPAYEQLLGALGLAAVRTLTSSGVEVRRIPVEDHSAEHYTASVADTQAQLRSRTESVPQDQYMRHLIGLGREVGRRHIRVGGEDLFTDLHDETAGTVIEVKSSADRKTVRLALGQVLDYAHHLTPEHMAVLLPAAPAPDLIRLLTSHGVSVIWPASDGGFATTAGPCLRGIALESRS